MNPHAQLRVLLVTGAYYPEVSAGGLQSRAVAALLKHRVSFAVLTTATDPLLPTPAMVDGLEVDRVYIDIRNRWSRLAAFVRLTRTLLRLLPRVDLVHLQGYSTKNILVTGLAKLLRRPVIVHLQTARHDEPETIAAHGRLAWWAFSAAHTYLSVSPGLARKYLDAGLPEERLRVVPNGVDASRFSPANHDEKMRLRVALGLRVDQPIVVFVGVLSHDKQPHVLFEAWRELQRDTATAGTLVLIGSRSEAHFEADATLADRIEADAAGAGISDRLVVVPPTNRIDDYFRAADIYVMPSLREGLPIALLEAMACGLPCIASNLPGATDVIIENGVNGWLVPVGDAAAITRALHALIANPSEGSAVGAAARRTVEERYALPRVAEQWLNAYEAAAGRGFAPPD